VIIALYFLEFFGQSDHIDKFYKLKRLFIDNIHFLIYNKIYRIPI